DDDGGNGRGIMDLQELLSARWRDGRPSVMATVSHRSLRAPPALSPSSLRGDESFNSRFRSSTNGGGRYVGDYARSSCFCPRTGCVNLPWISVRVSRDASPYDLPRSRSGRAVDPDSRARLVHRA